MLFFSNFFNFSSNNINKLEKQAKDVLELPDGFKAYRLEKDIAIVDTKKGKIVERTKDTLPSNPVRATLEFIKKLKLNSDGKLINKKSDVWTCGFRENEERWVWYLNSQPKMTVGYEEAFERAFKNGNLEDKAFFYSARYGSLVVNKLKESSIEKIAKEINARILENPFVKIKCGHCSNEDNYTIDDIVDKDRNPKYDSNFVVCQNCNEVVKLI